MGEKSLKQTIKTFLKKLPIDIILEEVGGGEFLLTYLDGKDEHNFTVFFKEDLEKAKEYFSQFFPVIKCSATIPVVDDKGNITESSSYIGKSFRVDKIILHNETVSLFDLSLNKNIIFKLRGLPLFLVRADAWTNQESIDEFFLRAVRV